MRRSILDAIYTQFSQFAALSFAGFGRNQSAAIEKASGSTG